MAFALDGFGAPVLASGIVDQASPELLDLLLSTWAGPLVIDADALNLLAGRVDHHHGQPRARLGLPDQALDAVGSQDPEQLRTDRNRVAEFLRVGRVGLFYQTADGAETGYWDRDKKDWTADGGYAEGVTEGLKVAKKQASPNLLIVPMQAAANGGQ